MIKRIFQKCLITAAICGLVSTAYAADMSTSVNGRVRNWLVNESEKNGPSSTQIKSDGIMGVTVNAEAGDWTVSAINSFDLDSDDGLANPTIRDQVITLSNDSMAINIGKFYPYGVTKGMAYVSDNIGNSYWVGENVPTAARVDHLTVNLKDVGITALLGMNDYTDSTFNETYSEMMLGAIYSGTFGPIDLGAQVLSGSQSIDKDASPSLVSGAYDGAAYSSLAVGVNYKINDPMAVSFNFESNSLKSGISGADPTTSTIMEFWFDMGFDETSGISVGYGTKTDEDSSKNATNNTMVNVAYGKRIGAANLYAMYYSGSTQDHDIDPNTNAKTDASTTRIGGGVTVDF